MKSIGSHMSYGNNISTVFKTASIIEADIIQICIDSSNIITSTIHEPIFTQFFKGRINSKIGLVSHASVMINLANPEVKKQNFAKRAFYAELHRADQLGLKYIVLHPGAHMGQGVEEGLDTFTKNMDAVIDKVRPFSKILLETMPKAGTRLGNKFHHLQHIFNNSRFPDQLGVTLDTVHLMSAGYELRGDAYEDTMSEFDAIIGFDKLKLVHANDSANELGEPERHALIGQGYLGVEVFTKMMNDSRFKSVPFVIEPPKGTSLADIAQNIDLLRSMEVKGK